MLIDSFVRKIPTFTLLLVVKGKNEHIIESLFPYLTETLMLWGTCL